MYLTSFPLPVYGTVLEAQEILATKSTCFTPVSMVLFSLVTETWHYLWWPHWNITFTSLSLSWEVDTMILTVVGEWDFWKLFKMIYLPLGFLYMITTNTFLCYFLICHYIFIIYILLYVIFHIIFSLQKRISLSFLLIPI